MKRFALLPLLLVPFTVGWAPCLFPKIAKRNAFRRKKLLLQKRRRARVLVAGGAALVAAPLVVGGGLVAAGGAAAGAAALGRANAAREVYEPPAGSMDGKVVVITGGSSGLGLESSKRLAAAGATVVLTSRTAAGCAEAADRVRDYLSNKGVDASDVYGLQLDLDDLSNVKEFAAKYEALGLGDVAVLLNNAGCMAVPTRELTIDGVERQFQSNHLGHFVLTAGLFPYLSRDGSRVINVSSSASNFAGPNGLDLDNLNGERNYAPWTAYGASKLANILFTNELQRRADESDLTWLTAASLHPGVVNTDLWRYIVGEDRLADLKSEGNVLGSIAMGATSLFALTPEQGASTQVFLAAEEEIVKGAFYDDMEVKTGMPAFARDEGKARALWEESERLGGVAFDLTPAPSSVDDESTPVDVVVEDDEEAQEEAQENKTSEDDEPVAELDEGKTEEENSAIDEEDENASAEEGDTTEEEAS